MHAQSVKWSHTLWWGITQHLHLLRLYLTQASFLWADQSTCNFQHFCTGTWELRPVPDHITVFLCVTDPFFRIGCFFLPLQYSGKKKISVPTWSPPEAIPCLQFPTPVNFYWFTTLRSNQTIPIPARIPFLLRIGYWLNFLVQNFQIFLDLGF